MSEHFFSRWSQRKQAVAKGLPVVEPAATPSPTELSGVPGSSEGVQRSQAAPPALASGQAEAKSSEMPAEPLPSLDDASALTPDSDFQPFMRPGVTADVRNVAMKKLFTDPHFNVMDGLDTYIEDYGLPDPIPLAMLRQMTQSKMLGLFADEENKNPEDSDEKPADENTAVRLQPDDAAGHGGDCPDADAHAGGERGRAGDDAHPAVPT